jgi:hypothetical protein
MKIRPVAAKLLHPGKQMDGGRDMMKLKPAFSNSSNTPKNPQYLSCK